MASVSTPRPTDGTTARGVGLVVRGAGAAVELESITVEPPGRGEVRIAVDASGICHTDTSVARGRSWWPDFPYVLGHEGVGRIESVGLDVDPSRIGQRVLLAWKSPCGRCRFCSSGRGWLCADPPRAGRRIRLADDDSIATPSLRVGSHASFAVVPSAAAIPVPAELEPSLACLLGCAVLTGVGAVRNTASVEAGQTVAIFGCGGVGLSIILGARLAGASTIVAVEPVEARRAVATSAGASIVIDPAAADVIEGVRQATDGFGVDHAFVAVGDPAVLEVALGCLDSGGTATLVGTPDPGDLARVDLERAYLQRVVLRVSQYGDVIPARDAPALAAQHLRGDLDLALLLGREVTPEEAPSLFRPGSSSAIRQVIRFAT